jgi:DNA polymerase elongation subunit (family B)
MGSPFDGVYPTADRHPKILIWDIETTNLKADFGKLLCYKAQWYGDDKIIGGTIRHTKAFKAGRFWEDKELVLELHKLLTQADCLVHHFGDRFDLKFFKTRLIELGLYFPNVKTVDTWKVAKKHLLLQSNRMGNIAEFLGGEQKSSVPKKVWIQANMGHAPSIRLLENYCEQDVRTLAGIYKKLLPYTRTINHNLFYAEQGCPGCSSKQLIKNGFRYTNAGKIQRYQCTDCGTFCDSGKPLRAQP